MILSCVRAEISVEIKNITRATAGAVRDRDRGGGVGVLIIITIMDRSCARRQNGCTSAVAPGGGRTRDGGEGQ